MVCGMRRITSFYSKATSMRKGSNVAEGSGKRPRGRPKGRAKGGGKIPLPVPSSPSELPSAHSSSEEEEVQVEEEAGVEEEIGVVSRSLDPPEATDTS